MGRTRPRVNNLGVSGFVNLETVPWPGEGERCLGCAPTDEDRNLALLNLNFGKKVRFLQILKVSKVRNEFMRS